MPLKLRTLQGIKHSFICVGWGFCRQQEVQNGAGEEARDEILIFSVACLNYLALSNAQGSRRVSRHENWER